MKEVPFSTTVPVGTSGPRTINLRRTAHGDIASRFTNCISYGKGEFLSGVWEEEIVIF